MTRNRVSTVLRLGAGLMAATSLSACLGSGSGGGGGGGGGPVDVTQYDTNLERVRDMIPTSDMQTTGTASFSGNTYLEPVDGTTGHIIGDVNIDVDFAAANDAAISGTANNFRGVLDGEDVAMEGELSTGPRFPSAFVNDDIAVPVPPGGPIPGAPATVRPGSASIAMYGDIVDEGDTSTVLLTLGGNFVGPGGQALHGPALLQEITGTSVAERAASGTFYVERD
ncbi:hypothetical protein [Oceaniglobus trochenteri]|uniref:hypothetical protein n=1 Tax=Oceaniglobus trochenteri TaxID=2763260 RepID=UPI001CFFA49B|nr:hypothetical protein [Oceaniglobus trochenteri]